MLEYGERGALRTDEPGVVRDAALFLDRWRGAIDGEVERRLGRSQPPTEVRAEIVRRFRSFCRLASAHTTLAQPSLEGLAAISAPALERTIKTAVDAALLCGASQAIARQLRELEARFSAGIRRVMRPEDSEVPRRVREQSRKRVRAAIDRIGDAYFALCLETGRVCDLNPAAEALFGGAARDLLERSFAELVAPGDRDLYQALEARLDAGELPPPTELTLARLGGGEPIPASVSMTQHTIGGRRVAICIARERVA